MSLHVYIINEYLYNFLFSLQSEERGKEEYASSEKTQDTRIARSAGNSLDKLGGSSASVDPDGLYNDTHLFVF